MSWCAWLALVIALTTQDALERAQALARNGEVAKAIRLLESSTRREATPAELAFLAQLQASVGGIPQAAAALERAVALAPEQLGLRITLGAMLFELRRFDEAKELLERVVREAPEAGLAHYYLGAALKGMGDLEAASRRAETAVSLTPVEPPAVVSLSGPPPAASVRHLLAEIRFELGEDVEVLLREVLEIEPLHASARYLLGRALLRKGREEEAKRELALFERIKRADKLVERAQELSGLEGRRQESIAELRRAVEAYPEHVRALFLLGLELLRTGRREEAVSFLERAVAARPGLRPEVERLLKSSR